MTRIVGERSYEAAVSGVALKDRSSRGRFVVQGRAAVQMLDGILTASVPPRPGVGGSHERRGEGSYSAVLTPKGRMITDLRVVRLDEGDADGAEERILVDVPIAGQAPLLAHLGRYLPPRLAKVEDVSDRTGMLTVLGPGGPDVVSREALGLRTEAGTLIGLGEDDYVEVDSGGGERVLVLRTADVAAPALDVVADASTIRGLRTRLLESGAEEVDDRVWETLRVEAGRPEYGVDMDDETLPVEAGIHTRAIDYTKGCYTGQEVIVRIRDRGRVNRHLRGLRMGDATPPPRGAEIYAPEKRGESSVGVVTSAVTSPRSGETLALGYLRREIQPGDVVRIGSPEGAPAVAASLDEGWRPEG